MKNLFKKSLPMVLIFVFAFALLCPMEASAASTRKCYTISSGNTTVYSNTGLTKKSGTIYASDELTVISVTSKYSKVSYSVTGTSRTKSGYIPTSAILLATSGTTYKASAKITTYRRKGGTTYGFVSKNDSVIVLGTSGSYVQIKYPVTGGYKYAFVTKSNADKYITGTSSSSSASSNSSSSNNSYSAQLTNMMNGSAYSGAYKIGKQYTGEYYTEQCKGFARSIHKKLFGYNIGSTKSKPYNYQISFSSSNTKCVGSVTSMTSAKVKTLFSQARVGDFVQMRRTHGGSHSAIVVSVSSSGITFFECNLDGKNTISKNTYTWSSLCSKNAAMSLYTAKKY